MYAGGELAIDEFDDKGVEVGGPVCFFARVEKVSSFWEEEKFCSFCHGQGAADCGNGGSSVDFWEGRQYICQEDLRLKKPRSDRA